MPASSYLSRDEIAYLEGFLADLSALPTDSKLTHLKRDLEEVTAVRDRVLVFTQYLDTLDYLREELAPFYDVACYSGRGGEILGSEGWSGLDKESLKERFGRGEIQVLLCTEAAGEGLNFQSCGVLINYDMPWNPMRVEQRIGRIDRIGQRYGEVWIRNYFYADTVEATIYRRLAKRIDWFQNVLGDVQPILHRVGESMRALALTPSSRRPKSTDETLASLEAQLEARAPEVIGDGTDELSAVDPPLPSPVPWRELEGLLLGSRLGDCFAEDGELEGAYRLRFGGTTSRVTFDPALFARYPYSLHLLTWGNGLFEALLDAVPEPVWDEEPGGLGWYGSALPSPVDLFLAPLPETAALPIAELEGLRRVMEQGPRPWTATIEGGASSTFSKARRRVLEGQAQVDAERRAAEREALRAGAADVLLRSALVELARAENPGLFDRRLTFGFGPEAILAQARHGDPFASLVKRLGDELPMVSAQDPRYEDLRRRSPEALYRYQEKLFEEGRALLERRLEIEAADREAQRRQKDLSGLLLRRYALWTPRRPMAPLPRPPLPVSTVEELAAEGAVPFVDAVPFFDSLEDVVAFLSESTGTTGSPFAELQNSPSTVLWVRPEGRYGAAPGLFVCPMGDAGLEPHVGAESYLLLRLSAGVPRPGDRVLIHHPSLRHVDDGREAVVRIWQPSRGADRRSMVTLKRGDGSLCAAWDEDEASEVTLYAELLESFAPEPGL